MSWIPILGVVVVVVGLALSTKYKINPVLAVLAGGFVSGYLGGLGTLDILETIGRVFVANRVMILFLIMLPAIGNLQKYGLIEQMGYLIQKVKGATPGRVSYIFQLFREGLVALGVRIGGHPAFVKPLIEPLARGSYDEEPDEETKEDIKAMTSSAENIGNFFAQNVFPAAAGILLIQGVMSELGYDVTLVDLAIASVPVAVIAALYGAIFYMVYQDKSLEKGKKQREKEEQEKQELDEETEEQEVEL